MMVLAGPEWAGDTEHTVQATGLLPQGFSERLILEDAAGALVDTFPVVDAPSEGSLNRWFDGQAGAEVGAHTALTASGRRASPGLRMDGGAWSDAPTAPSFVMNELMPNPAGTDLGAEYVELVNAGTVPLDPTGWTLCDASGVCHTFGPPALLPGEALVLFDRGDHSDVPGARGAESERLSLNNSGETVTLTEPDGTVHDEVYWSSCTEGVAEPHHRRMPAPTCSSRPGAGGRRTLLLPGTHEQGGRRSNRAPAPPFPHQHAVYGLLGGGGSVCPIRWRMLRSILIESALSGRPLKNSEKGSSSTRPASLISRNESATSAFRGIATHPSSWTSANGNMKAKYWINSSTMKPTPRGSGVPLLRSQPPWMVRKSIRVLSMHSTR